MVDSRGRGPQDAPGSRAINGVEPASFGRRLAAFSVDAVASGLVARLIDPIEPTGRLDATAGLLPVVVFAVVTIAGLALVGQTPGMRLLGLRVVRYADGGRPGLVPAALRTALLLLLLPAVIMDAEGRGLHDKAAGTIVRRG